jgi:hypothetical protein
VLTLEALQHAFASAVRGIGAAPNCILGDGLAPEARMNVYRNNYLTNLTNALRRSYPAIERLVGASFFDGAAATFIADRAPLCANLNNYGAGFAEFLAGFVPAAGVPYLADVARLEWAVSSAINAADAGPLDAAGLAQLAQAAEEELRFTPHPSVSLVRAKYPVDAIWEATLGQDDDALAAIRLTAGPVWLLVMRQANDEIKILSLAREEWNFVAALCADNTFTDALAAAQGVDAAGALGRLLAVGALTGYRLGNS